MAAIVELHSLSYLKHPLKSAVLLGAGFSKWAASVPLASELFDFKIELTSEREARRLYRTRLLWEKWNRANNGKGVEEFIYWALNDSYRSKSNVIWYVSRRLSEPFMSRIQGGHSALMFDEKSAKIHPGITRAAEFFTSAAKANLAGLLTTNYDTVIECALGTDKFNYGIPGERLTGRGHNPVFPHQFAHRPVTGSLALAKLHGSLSWTETEKYTSGRPGRNGLALIVPPAPEKEPPSALLQVWVLAAEILGRSRNLVVFGFAFNPYDSAILELLRSEGKSLERILLIDPNPNKLAASALWPNATIDSFTVHEYFLEELEEWLLA